MIYGLFAALGWGLADFFAHLAGRRLGSLMAVAHRARRSPRSRSRSSSSRRATASRRSAGGGGWWRSTGSWRCRRTRCTTTRWSWDRCRWSHRSAPATPSWGSLLAIAVLGERPSSVAFIGIGCSYRRGRARVDGPHGDARRPAAASARPLVGGRLGRRVRRGRVHSGCRLAEDRPVAGRDVRLAVGRWCSRSRRWRIARAVEFSRLRTATVLGVTLRLVRRRHRRARGGELLGRRRGAARCRSCSRRARCSR